MKSYLTGSPQLHLALNDQLVIAGGGHAGYGMVELDNVNFHECVDLGKFEAERMLVLEPPHGEFVLMNFHIGSLRHEGQIPFRVTPMLSAISEYAIPLMSSLLCVATWQPDRLCRLRIRGRAPRLRRARPRGEQSPSHE